MTSLNPGAADSTKNIKSTWRKSAWIAAQAQSIANSISGRNDGKAPFEAKKWPFVELVRQVRHEDCKEEGQDCSHSATPAREMKQFADAGEPHLTQVKDKVVGELMKEIEVIRDAAEVDDRSRQEACGRAQQAEKEQCGSNQHKRPTDGSL